MDWSKAKISWLEITHEFSAKYDDVFLRRNAKAHFDFCDVVIDGAKERWRHLLLMDAVLSIFLQKLPSDHRSVRRQFEHHEVFRECTIQTFHRMISSYSNTGNSVEAISPFLGNIIPQQPNLLGLRAIDNMLSATYAQDQSHLSLIMPPTLSIGSVPQSNNNSSSNAGIGIGVGVEDPHLTLLSLRRPNSDCSLNMNVNLSSSSSTSSSSTSLPSPSTISSMFPIINTIPSMNSNMIPNMIPNMAIQTDNLTIPITRPLEFEILKDVFPPWDDITNFKNGIWKADRVKKGYLKRKRIIDQLCDVDILQGPNALKRVLNQVVMRLLIISFPQIRPQFVGFHQPTSYANSSTGTNATAVDTLVLSAGNSTSQRSLSNVVSHASIKSTHSQQQKQEEEVTGNRLHKSNNKSSISSSSSSSSSGDHGNREENINYENENNIEDDENDDNSDREEQEDDNNDEIKDDNEDDNQEGDEIIENEERSKVDHVNHNSVLEKKSVTEIPISIIKKIEQPSKLSKQSQSQSKINQTNQSKEEDNDTNNNGGEGDSSVNNKDYRRKSEAIFDSKTSAATNSNASTSQILFNPTTTATKGSFIETSSNSRMDHTGQNINNTNNTSSAAFTRFPVSPFASDLSSTSILYGVRLRPQHQPGDWCAVGSIVGYYTDGIARPSSTCVAFVVVITKHSGIRSSTTSNSNSNTSMSTLLPDTYDIGFQGIFQIKLDIELLLLLRESVKNELLCWTAQGNFNLWDNYLSKHVTNPSVTITSRVIGIIINQANSYYDIRPNIQSPLNQTAMICLTPVGEILSLRHEVQTLRIQMQNLYSFFSAMLQQHEAVLIEHEMKRKDHEEVLYQLVERVFPRNNPLIPSTAIVPNPSLADLIPSLGDALPNPHGLPIGNVIQDPSMFVSFNRDLVNPDSNNSTINSLNTLNTLNLQNKYGVLSSGLNMSGIIGSSNSNSSTNSKLNSNNNNNTSSSSNNSNNNSGSSNNSVNNISSMNSNHHGVVLQNQIARFAHLSPNSTLASTIVNNFQPSKRSKLN